MCSSQLDSKDPMHPLRFGAWMAAENLATKNKLKKEFVELFGPAVGAGFFHSRERFGAFFTPTSVGLHLLKF